MHDMTRVLAAMVAAVALGGCTDNGTSTTTTQTPWTSPPPSGPCASLYDESLGSQVLAHTVFSDQGAEHSVRTGQLIRVRGSAQEALEKGSVTNDCIRLLLPEEGTYFVVERSQDDYSGNENCHWAGASRNVVHDGKPYYEVNVQLNFQCSHA